MFRAVSLASGLLVLVVLGLIAVTMSQQAWPAFAHEGLRFLTGTRWAPSANIFGALPFIYGTLVASVIALVFAVPVSIGIALFLTDIAPRRLRKPISFLIDLLAAVPSVVFGLWGLAIVAPHLGGKTYFTAGVVLALMVTPIVTSVTREVFATVPSSQKEAAFALGATRWEMVRGAVFPHGRNGMIGAVMLGLGRAMGETIAVTLVIGGSANITTNIFKPGYAMAAVIADQFGEASGLHRSALVGLGVALFLMTVVVNMAARVIVRKSDA
jgi:phosphate transport system permease protein